MPQAFEDMTHAINGFTKWLAAFDIPTNKFFQNQLTPLCTLSCKNDELSLAFPHEEHLTAHERLEYHRKKQEFLAELTPIVEATGIGKVGLRTFELTCYISQKYAYLTCSAVHSGANLIKSNTSLDIQSAVFVLRRATYLLGLHAFTPLPGVTTDQHIYVVNQSHHVRAAAPADAVVLHLIDVAQDVLTELLEHRLNVSQTPHVSVAKMTTKNALVDLFPQKDAP